MAAVAMRTMLAGLVGAAAVGATAAGYHVPRTTYGQPDLQGMWNNASLTPLQRPPGFRALEAGETEAAAYERSPPPLVVDDVGGDENEHFERGSRLGRIAGRPRTSVIVDPADGRLPYTAAGRQTSEVAVQRARTNFDAPETRMNSERCLLSNTTGPPMLMAPYNNNIQIVQVRDAVVFLLEWNHDARIVRLGASRHPPEAIRPWMGDSVGWWDGETLVIETTNFNAGQQVRRLGVENYYLSPRAKIIERLTRVSPTQILYRFTVQDPGTYRQAWRGEVPFVATSARAYEFACHEGNYGLPNILAGARATEAAEASGQGRGRLSPSTSP